MRAGEGQEPPGRGFGRRTFLSLALSSAGFGAVTVLTACTNGTLAPEGAGSSKADDGTTSASPERTVAPNSGGGVLVAYFSRPGENYYYGDRTTIEVGNTEIVARMIPELIQADVYRIEAADPYPFSYDATVARNVREQQDQARPVIANPLPDVTGYSTVILASPIWNVRPPRIMRTFIDGVDLTGKTVLPLVTYAVSGLGGAVDEYTEACPGAHIGDGLAVQGEEAAQAEPDVEQWLRRTDLRA